MSHQYSKKGNKSKAENYRPISLTSVSGKILERCIRGSIVDHMSSNNLIVFNFLTWVYRKKIMLYNRVFNYFKHHVYYVSINSFIYYVSKNNFLEQHVYNNMLFMFLILD